MGMALRDAQERIRRFERLGGITLSERDLEDPLLAEIRTGIVEHKRDYFVFECPTCHNRVRNTQEMEPMCTGPSWTNDHEPIVMEFVPTDDLKLALLRR